MVYAMMRLLDVLTSCPANPSLKEPTRGKWIDSPLSLRIILVCIISTAIGCPAEAWLLELREPDGASVDTPRPMRTMMAVKTSPCICPVRMQLHDAQVTSLLPPPDRSIVLYINNASQFAGVWKDSLHQGRSSATNH